MICPACGYENLPGQDRCVECLSSLMQDDVPQPDTSIRWRVMVDPISSLEPSTIEPQSVASGTTVAAAVRRMQEKGVGYLMVTGSDGVLSGILTEHELLCHVAGQECDLERLTVDEIMRTDPPALRASEPIKHALHEMAVNDFMYVPIVDDAGRPVDLLSFRRVARLIDQMG